MLLPIETIRAYAAQVERQLTPAQKARDPQYVHQLRVACRRLRNALKIFKSYFPSHTIKTWNQSLCYLARQAGAARDLDVHIEFLREYQAGIRSGAHRREIGRLLIRFQRQRRAIQPKVRQAIIRARRQGTLADIMTCAVKTPLLLDKDWPPFFLAAAEIERRIKKLQRLGSYAYQPHLADQLHQLRIAAKHLRYALEIFVPLYGPRLETFIGSALTIQRTLGDWHDYDVWLEAVQKHPSPVFSPAVYYLQQRYQRSKDQAYRKFVRHWRTTAREKIWDKLHEFIRDPEKRFFKVALIADIHANDLALQAVLADARQQGVDAVWHLGDFVGHGPFPEEAVQRLYQPGIINIAGNYDLKVLDFPRQRRTWQGTKHPAKYFSFRWTHARLSRSSKDFLVRLPYQRRLVVQGLRFLLVHGSPAGIDDPISRATSLRRLRTLAKKAGAAVVCCGHTHEYFVRRAGGVIFINPGSVGRPFDGDARSSYAIITVRDRRLTVRNRRLAYPLAATLQAMRQNKFPAGLIQALQKGRSLDDLPRK